MNHFQKHFLSPPHRNGSILIVSIWILVFFSILSVGLYKIVSSQINVVKTIEGRTISQYLAKAAFTYASLERKKDKLTYDSLDQLGTQREKELGRGKFIYTFIDEGSKININSAPPEIIANLPGLTLELAKAITESTLKPFHAKEEILLVEGINEEIFNNFKNFISIYSDGKVNINTAPTEVLRAWGFSDNLMITINGFRTGMVNELMVGKENFESSADIITKFEHGAGLSESDAAFLNQLIVSGLIVVKSGILSLEVATEIVGRPTMKYAIIMDTERIKEWREY